jgi:hypothetical protein
VREEGKGEEDKTEGEGDKDERGKEREQIDKISRTTRLSP